MPPLSFSSCSLQYNLIIYREHLYRNHSLPISCPRCHEPFLTEFDRDSHVRSTERCEIREPPDGTGGFTTTQRDLLKSRKKGYKQLSEPQKWREIYLILFPDTESTDIPSPCKQHLTSMRLLDSTAHKS